MKKYTSLNSINSTNPINPKTPEAIRNQILDLVKEYHTAKFAPKVFDPNKDLVHYAGRVFGCATPHIRTSPIAFQGI